MTEVNRSVHAASREVYRYTHANMRLRLRYQMELDLDEYRELCQKMRQKQFFKPRVLSTGEVEAWVELRGQWVCACYKPHEGLIATFLPCPPGVQEMVASMAKAENQPVVKNVIVPAQTKVTTHDSANDDPKVIKMKWLKNTARLVQNLMGQGKTEEAVTLLEDVSRHRRPTRNIPGQGDVVRAV